MPAPSSPKSAPSKPVSTPVAPESAPNSQPKAHEYPVNEGAELSDAVNDDEQTDVMGRDQLPDFDKHEGPEEADRRPPQRPSTFTRLLLNPRR